MRPLLTVIATTCLLAGEASAMCRMRAELGFPHASQQRFPANVRGMLFQAGAGELTPADFAVVAADTGLSLRAELEAVQLPKNSAAARELPRDVRLVRVLVEGGYQAGRQYSVTYIGSLAHSSFYPTAISFTVDADAVELNSSDFALRLEPEQVKMHTDWNGDVGESTYSALRGFNTGIPAHLASYQTAVSLFPEWADTSSDGFESGFRPVHKVARSCNGRSFGASKGPDLVFRVCTPLLKPALLRSSAALLEVSDTLVPITPTPVTWSSDAASACLAAQGRQ